MLTAAFTQWPCRVEQHKVESSLAGRSVIGPWSQAKARMVTATRPSTILEGSQANKVIRGTSAPFVCTRMVTGSSQRHVLFNSLEEMDTNLAWCSAWRRHAFIGFESPAQLVVCVCTQFGQLARPGKVPSYVCHVRVSRHCTAQHCTALYGPPLYSPLNFRGNG